MSQARAEGSLHAPIASTQGHTTTVTLAVSSLVNPFATATELGILAPLESELKGLYALQIVRAAGGKLSRGSIYTLLGRLEWKGFVISLLDHGAVHSGLQRPRYILTKQGQQALAAAAVMGLDPANARS